MSGIYLRTVVGERGSAGAVVAFTGDMHLREISELLNPSFEKAIGNDLGSLTVLKLLLQMALGINYRSRGGGCFSRPMMSAAIDKGYEPAVSAIIHLERQVLTEVDTKGRTPFAYAYHLRRNEICEILLQSYWVDIETATEVVKLEGDFTGHVHAAIEKKCLQLLKLLLAMDIDIEEVGQSPLTHAAEVVLNSEDIDYESWNDIFRALLDNASPADIETIKEIKPEPGARRCVDRSMHTLVEKDYKSILAVLSLTGSRDAEGWTPLASAAFNNNEPLCEFLLGQGCTLCLDMEQKKQLKPKLSCRIHNVTWCGNKTALKLLLDMGADINERFIW